MRLRKTYLLIFLSLWIHFDDVLLTALPQAHHVPFAADDDHYLAIKRQQPPNCGCSPLKLGVGLRPPTADCVPTGTAGAASLRSTSACLLAPPLLYSFMSLQL